MLLIPSFPLDWHARELGPDHELLPIAAAYLLLCSLIYTTASLVLYNLDGGGSIAWGYVTVPVLPLLLVMSAAGAFRVWQSFLTLCLPYRVFWKKRTISAIGFIAGAILLTSISFLLKGIYYTGNTVVPVSVSAAAVISSFQLTFVSFPIEGRFSYGDNAGYPVIGGIHEPNSWFMW